MRSVHIGRQPIYDRELAVHGYELRFRRTRGGQLPDALVATDVAVTQMILNTITEHGLDRLAGDRPAFINVTRPFVVGELAVPFGPEHGILDLLSGIAADDDVLEGCKLLGEEGYRFALDDFWWEPARRELLPYAAYVKIDVLNRSADEVDEALLLCREAGVPAVAQRIGDKTTLEWCKERGFDYFQGTFFLHPEVVIARNLSPSHLAAMQVLAKLSDPDISIADIESAVRIDLALSYRVLRAANSATHGLSRPVESIRDALVLLGAQRLRSWLLLMVLAATGEPDEEQLSTAMTRARTCELMAQADPALRPASAFVVGVLSAMDIVLGLPMADVVDHLPLADDLREALLSGTGPLGELLTAVRAYEVGDDDALAASPFDAFELSRAYLNAVGWSLQLCASALSA
jgi:c-di-GMP-related signal transduction protein